MTVLEKAKKSVLEAARLLREKPFESTLAERYFLLNEALDTVKDLPQPLQMGKGLCYILGRASLPIAEHDLLLGRFDDHVPTEEEQARLEKIWSAETNPIVKFNWGHTTLDTETLVNIGISGYIARAEKRIAEVKADASEELLSYLEGVKYTFEAVRNYIKRYGEAAEKAGLIDCAQVCFSLVKGAPQTFREALQLILFVYNVYLIYAGNEVACLNVGRLDDVLLKLYLKDLEKGMLTEELAGCFIDDFSAKMSLHLGRGEHQMGYLNPDYKETGWLRNHVYDSPGYISLGGYSNHTDHRTNPLSILFAKHIHPTLKNPVYICRYTKEDSSKWLDILSEKIKENSSLLIYNDETVIPAHLHIGVEKENAVNYSIHPCNWADIDGGSVIEGHCGKPLPFILNEVLHSGRDFKSMEDIYTATEETYAELLKGRFSEYRKKYSENAPSTCSTLSLTECFRRGFIDNIDKGAKDRVKYPAVYVYLRNIGTAADMLSTVDHLVFREKKYSLQRLVEAADNNFESDLEILKACKNAPKFGNDDPLADRHAVSLMTRLLDLIDKEATNSQGIRDVITLNVTINDSNHLEDGEVLNATVDGRRKGEPLSENLSPAAGVSHSVTEVMNSVSKLPFDRIHSGALNIRLSSSALKAENAERGIRALMETYFGKGGMQLQFSIVDTNELYAAQKNPEKYSDLLVRITGYSAVFVDMAKGAQDEFIRREELK